MAIRNFSVGGLRGLVSAQAEALGNLVVVAGPNGAGKSSLLDLLRAQRRNLAEPGTEVMFVGPHRTWRSSQLNRVSVYGFGPMSYGDLLTLDNMPGFQYAVPQGLQGLQNQPRKSSSADDVQAFVKTSLVRLRDRQQNLVTQAWQAQGGQVLAGSVPDLFQPFARLIATLLSHLEWVGVTEHSSDNIQCLFRPAGTDGPDFDIDELSSGEKAAIALLLPLVERQATQMTTPADVAPGVVPLTMLLDEPEIHLHPLLQLQVLNYIRQLAAEGAAQFILTTQSPTLLDALTDDELWLLSPASLCPDNQLSRLTTNGERLEVARALTGSTHMLTRSKPIVFVEGEAERAGVASDARLIATLIPATRSWALVPGRAKNDVIEAVRRLRQESVNLPGTPVFGLVDADRDRPSSYDYVVVWPVTMIENLLLDPDAIYRALAPLGGRSLAHSAQAVEQVLASAVSDRVEEEVQLRVYPHLPVGRLVLPADQLADAEQLARQQTQEWLQKLQCLDVEDLTAAAREEVNYIRASGKELERFHGKRLLRKTYEALGVSGAGLSLPAFQLMVAEQAADTDRLRRLTQPAIDQIRLFFPDTLAAVLRSTENCPEELAIKCEHHWDRWTTGTPDGLGRLELREAIFAHARTLSGPPREQIVRLASQIGTQ